MKSRLAIFLLAGCASPAFLFSQAPLPPPGGGQLAMPLREKMRDKFLDSLPPEVRKRFETAREMAVQDPKVKELKGRADAAAGEFRTAMRESMMKADPGLADVLKQQAAGKLGKDGDRNHGGQPPLSQLSEGDRQKLMAAREIAKDDPAVQQAEAKMKAATTPEERRAAAGEFHRAMRAALLKADPTLEPILDQIKPPAHPKRPGAGDGDNPAGPAPTNE